MSFLSDCSILELMTVISDSRVIILFENEQVSDSFWEDVERSQETHFIH